MQFEATLYAVRYKFTKTRISNSNSISNPNKKQEIKNIIKYISKYDLLKVLFRVLSKNWPPIRYYNCMELCEKHG